MKDADAADAARERAEAKQRKMADKAVEARASWDAAVAVKSAETEKTARLRALRLAKEQAERDAEAAKPPKTVKPKRVRAASKTAPKPAP